MQEDEIVSLIDSVYATFLRGDLDRIFGLVSDDTEWIVYGPAELPFTGEFRGPNGVKRFLEGLVTTQEDVKVEINDRMSQGNKALFLGTYTARIPATGKTVAVSFAHVWSVENGKITRLIDFFDTAAVKDAYQKS